MENYNRQQMYCNNRMHMCGCNNDKDRVCFDNMPLAMAYVPWQEWKDVYEPCKALEAGTLFAELNLPFMGRGVWKR